MCYSLSLFQGIFSDSKETACNAGDMSSIPSLGRSPGGGHSKPLQYLDGWIPWTEEPGGMQSTGSQRVRHNWATSMHARTIACQASLSVGVLRQEHSSGLPFSPLRDRSSQPRDRTLHWQVVSLPLSHQGKPVFDLRHINYKILKKVKCSESEPLAVPSSYSCYKD